MKTGQHNSQVT